jgi:AAA domain-containing protein
LSDTALQADLFAHIRDFMAAGYTVALTRLIVGPDGKKVMDPRFRPAAQWQKLDNPTLATVTEQIKAGANAYLYRLPEGVWVLDADTAVATDWLQIMTGRPPDVRTPHGAHWLVAAAQRPVIPPDAPPKVDTAPRQLYGPGSFYELGVYSGAVPTGDVPPCPSSLMGGTVGTAPGIGARSATEQASAQFLAPPPLTRERALTRLSEMLASIAQGEYGGAEARRGILAAAMLAGGLLHTGWFTYEQAASGIVEACAQRWGMADENDLKWITQGLADGSNRPLRTTVDVEVGKDSAGRKSLRDQLTDAAGMKAMKPPEYLIDKLLVRGVITRLFGASNTYKSFGALGMAAAVGTGTPWQYHEAKPGKVLYVAAEGAAGMGKRIAAWEEHHKRAMTGVTFLPARVAFGVPEHVAELFEIVAAEQYDLIVLDTQAKVTVGLDENSNSDMTRFITVLEDMRDLAGGACVLLIHHTGHDGDRARGASSMYAGIDTEIKFAKSDGTSITMSVEKQKDDEAEGNVALVWTGVGESATGKFASGVLVPGAAMAHPDDEWDAYFPAMHDLGATQGAGQDTLSDFLKVAVGHGAGKSRRSALQSAWRRWFIAVGSQRIPDHENAHRIRANRAGVAPPPPVDQG